MQSKKVLTVALRTLLVCLLFAVCMAIGGALSGLDRVARQASPELASPQSSSHAAQTVQNSQQQQPQRPGPAPTDLLLPFGIYSICVGAVASYLILRSSWHGWPLAGAMFAAMYGISTVASQIDSIVFLSSKLPRGMLQALFVQGAIACALFAPLAVILLGKWKSAMPGEVPHAHLRISASSAAWRIAFLIVAFVFLYMFFGYFVAWQNPELRRYYAGPGWPTFFASLRGNWQNSPWIYLVAAFRALLYIAFMYPLIRMLRVTRLESAAATALFLSAWTTVLLLPNPLMPPSVARSHFWETLGFSLVFGALLGWLLRPPIPAADDSVAAAQVLP